MQKSRHIGYQKKITPELEKEVVAFLNSNEGGVIYIGIDKTGKIVGVENPDEEQLLLKDRFKHNILPSCMGLFDIVLEKNEDKNVLKIIVAGGYEKPYYVKKYGLSEKGVFIRVGSSAEPMPTRQIEQLFSKRTRNSIGRIKSPKQDLRFQQLQIYYQSTGKLLNEQFAKNLELLTEENQYNYVAYLLNDVNGISVKVAKYSGKNQVDLIENEEYGYESLIKATKQVLDKLNLENKTITKITSKERQEKDSGILLPYEKQLSMPLYIMIIREKLPLNLRFSGIDWSLHRMEDFPRGFRKKSFLQVFLCQEIKS